MFGKALTSGKLLVTYAAAFVDPTMITGGAATLETLSAAYSSLAGKNSELSKLAAEIDKAFNAKLKTLTKPDDAQVILPQMLEAAGQHLDFAKNGLNADAILESITKGLTSKDYSRAHHTAFSNLIGPLVRDICADPRIEAAIRPQLTQEMFKRQQINDEKLDRILANSDTSRDELELIANRFDIMGAHSLSPTDLRQLLTQKAEEYRNLKSELKDLRSKFPQLGNVVAEALALLDGEKVDTKAVRAMVQDARKTLRKSVLDGLTQNAELAEVEAQTYLFGK